MWYLGLFLLLQFASFTHGDARFDFRELSLEKKAIRLVGVGLADDVLDSLVDCENTWLASVVFDPVCTPELTRVDGVSILVGNLNAEFLLNGHDDLDGIERVEAEVVGKVSGGLDL